MGWLLINKVNAEWGELARVDPHKRIKAAEYQSAALGAFCGVLVLFGFIHQSYRT